MTWQDVERRLDQEVEFVQTNPEAIGPDEQYRKGFLHGVIDARTVLMTAFVEAGE